MSRYKCRNCGYGGKGFIFQFTDYAYCLASNGGEPEYIGESPEWVKKKAVGEAEIGEPVGCPKCCAWGTHNFEIVE